MDRMERVERIVLYTLVLGLAIVVGYLALERGRESGQSGYDKHQWDHIAAKLGTAVAEAVDQSFNQEGVVDEVADRVADTVTSKLLAARMATDGQGQVHADSSAVAADRGHPPPMTVNSRFTFLYENARLNEDGRITGQSVGVKPATRHRKRLELLTTAFRPCHRADAPVELTVTGYSSTAEFRVQPSGEPMPESDELNRKTANLRAQTVGDYLRNQGFSVDTIQWPPERDLDRPYLDQQALNRTVFVDIQTAGACEFAR